MPRAGRRWIRAAMPSITARDYCSFLNRWHRARECPAREAPPPGDAPAENALRPNEQSEAPILCLAGRGPLDEAASTMLAQLLRKHDLGARVARYRAASREAIATMDVSGTGMVCISYLDISGSPSLLRFLLQRLKKRLPNVPILVETRR